VNASETEARLPPLEAPFAPDVGALLERMMPPGIPPIALFRTFAHNPEMADAMHGWGSYELSRRLSVPMRIRELVIDRVTAVLGCEYEWGVHVVFFADRVGLTAEQVRSLTHGSPDDACWDACDRTVLRLVDSLLEKAAVDDDLWSEVASRFTAAQLLDLLLLAGWYHAIAFAANAAKVPLEDGTPRFADYA
jgi:alkylhydroperoxidase family enzyme